MTIPIEEIFEKADIKYKLLKLSQAAYTVEQTIQFGGGLVNVEEACKTIIVKGRKTGRLEAVLLRGADKLDFGKIRKYFGEDASIADAESVKTVSGVEPGAVCPFILTIPLVIDRRVLELDKINVGSGDHLCGLELATIDLPRLVNYEILDLVKL